MRLRALGLPLLGLVAFASVLLRPSPPAAPIVERAEESTAPATPPPLVVVDVAGAISRPGVVRLPAGSRILDALLAAGGMTPDADLQALNKAAPLRDGMRIYVPRPGEAAPADGYAAGVPDKVDLNAASAEELDALPGVGPAIATRIVRARTTRRFAKVEELQTRGLVSARVLADIRDLIVVR